MHVLSAVSGPARFSLKSVKIPTSSRNKNHYSVSLSLSVWECWSRGGGVRSETSDVSHTIRRVSQRRFRGTRRASESLHCHHGACFQLDRTLRLQTLRRATDDPITSANNHRQAQQADGPGCRGLFRCFFSVPPTDIQPVISNQCVVSTMWTQTLVLIG